MSLTNEYNLDPEDILGILDAVNELRIQSMMFDLEIDIENMSLVPKGKDLIPEWTKRWKEKELTSDRSPADYEGGE